MKWTALLFVGVVLVVVMAQMQDSIIVDELGQLEGDAIAAIELDMEDLIEG